MHFEQYSRRRFSLAKISILALFCGVVLLGSLYALGVFLNSIHSEFPVNKPVTIEEGLTHARITELLKEHKLVRSSFFAYVVLNRDFEHKYIQAGTYTFPNALSTADLIKALTEGTYREPLISVTLPEGFKVSDLKSYLPVHLQEDIPNLTEYEGYLFPDTYYVSRETDIDTFITLLRTTYDEKVAPYRDAIDASSFSEAEVIILASIIEREAKSGESKKIVSSILQNRLAIDMPLQVDATFDYLLGKESSELTLDDLALDSPYNTYLYTGLPPAPIANPGIESIEAVLYPQETPFMYYLTDTSGNFHYAETFEEHKENKRNYLN